MSYVTGSGTGTDIVGRIVSPAGVVGAQFEIANDGRDMLDPEIATLSNGNFVVVYDDHSAAIDDDVSMRIMTPTGATVLGPIWVAGTGSGAHETAPDVAALKGGGFVVVWGDESSEALHDFGVRATIYNNAGAVVRGNFAVNTTTPGNQIMSSVTSLDDGGFLVTWKDEGVPPGAGSPPDQLVRSQRFDAAGNKVGAEFTVMDTDHIAFVPEAAQLADGRIAYAIADDTGDREYDVFTSIWDPYGPRPDDFNKDARSDILWQQDNGTVGQWLMNGGPDPVTVASDRPPLEDVWHIEGIGDFNGDGRNDILLRHDAGDIGTWHMDGATVLSSQSLANAAERLARPGRRRFQRRRQERHPVAPRRRHRRHLAHGRRDRLSTQTFGRAARLAHPGHRRLQRRRQGRHPVASRRRHRRHLAHERRAGALDPGVRQRADRLAHRRHRRLQRRRQGRHPVAS